MNGYQEIKDLISDIDEFHNEAELREILQQILFICEDNIKKELPTTNQSNRQFKINLYKFTSFAFYHKMN